MEDPSVVILACGVVVALLLRGSNRRCRKRTVWIKDWIGNHQYYMVHINHLVQELQLGEMETYRNFLLMDSSTFELLSFVGPQIYFHDTHLWEVILAGEMIWFTFSAVHVTATVLYMCVNLVTKFTHYFKWV